MAEWCHRKFVCPRYPYRKLRPVPVPNSGFRFVHRRFSSMPSSLQSVHKERSLDSDAVCLAVRLAHVLKKRVHSIVSSRRVKWHKTVQFVLLLRAIILSVRFMDTVGIQCNSIVMRLINQYNDCKKENTHVLTDGQVYYEC